MARPTPIVMNTPIQGSFRESKSANLLEVIQGLSMLANLYKGTIGESKQRETDKAGIMEMGRALGLDRGKPASVVESGGYGLNMPSSPGIDLERLAPSKPGAEAIVKLFETQRNKKYENAPAGSIAFDPNDPNKQIPIGGKAQEVLSTPQLYSNPETKRQEMWYFNKSGEPTKFIRTATATDIKGNDAFADRELIKNTIKELPKLKDEAMRQSRNISTLNKALDMVKTGTVTGKGGQIKAFIQPYAEAAGVNTKGMDDAQTFNLLTRVITGPMRLELIGAGPVSEYEQKLMKEMSGGGATGQTAAYELLKYYKGIAKDKVSNYNKTLEGAISLDSTIGKIHRPVETQDNISSDSNAKSRYSKYGIVE